MIQLWGGATTRTLRAHWMLHEANVPYEPILIGSRTGETQTEAFRALNAKEKIPVLVDDDLVLTESAAIVTYVADTHARHLIPEPHTKDRARYNQWASFVQMELDAHTLYVMRKHRDLSEIYGEAPAAIEAAIAGFRKQVAVAETHLSTREYLVADKFTGADVLMSVCLTWAQLYEIEIADSLVAYNERLTSRPAYKDAARLNFSISAGA